jgi:hypothetical protein
MKRCCASLPILLVLLAGCGGTMSSPITHQLITQQPNYERLTDSVVWVAGDSLVGAWATPKVRQQNPTWKFYPPPVQPSGETAAADETSGALLTRLQTLLAAPPYPTVLIILVGTFDMVSPAWDGVCGDTCANESAIYTFAHTKGIKVLYCTVPYTTNAGAAGTELLTQYPGVVADEHLFDEAMIEPDEEDHEADGIVDIEDAIDPGSIDGGWYGATAINWTTDGLNPNATGALAFTTAAQEAIASQIR